MNNPASVLSSLERFTAYVDARGIAAEIIDCGSSTLTVAHAAEALSCEPGQILKTLLFHDRQDGYVIAIAAGLSRIDTSRLIQVSGLQTVKLASPAIVIDRLGYPAGGVPPIDLPAGIPVFIDNRAAALDTCYAGAGTTSHLVKIDPRTIVQINGATIAQLTGDGPR